MVLDSFYLSFYAVFRAHQNLKYEAVGIMVGQAIIVTAGAAVLLLHLSLHFLVGAILCGSVFNFFYGWAVLSQQLKIKLRLGFNRTILKVLLTIAAPFAISGIFARVYGYIDTVLLSTLAGDQAVGWYSAGYKITFALQFIPLAFAAAIFPAMANYFATNKAQLAKVFEKSMYYLMIMAVPISLGVFTLAREFIVRMYGAQFAPTTLALQILICSVFFNFLGFPLGSLLNACNRQVTNTVNMGITMVINIVLNIILIPLFGAEAYIGAAIAAVVAGASLFFLGLYWAGKIVRYNKIFLLKGFFKILFSGLLMATAIIFLKPFSSFFFLVPLGAVVYLGSLAALRGFDYAEIKEFYNSFRNKPAAPINDPAPTEL
jgi:O-antigen/teichoic acid export membrane protein